VSIVRVGLAETRKFAEGYEAIFGGKSKEAGGTAKESKASAKPSKKNKKAGKRARKS
jgi:hypothetical protein